MHRNNDRQQKMWLKQNVTLLQLVHIKLRPLNGLRLLNRNQIGFSSKFSIQIPRQNPNCHNNIDSNISDFNQLFPNHLYFTQKCSNFIKNGWKWCKIQLIWIFLIDFDNFNWFPHFQSFNQHFQRSFWFFNLIFNWKPSKSIDQKWSKKIENWLILNLFWHCPLIGIQFWSSDLNGTEIDVRSCWNPKLNCQQFDYEGWIA